QSYIFYVGCLGKHIDGLTAFHPVFPGEECDITGLSSWIATHIDNPFGRYVENSLQDFWRHSRTGLIGEDDGGWAVGCDLGFEDYFLSTARTRDRVLNMVVPCIDVGFIDGFRHMFYPDNRVDLLGQVKSEVADYTREIVQHHVGLQ